MTTIFDEIMHAEEALPKTIQNLMTTIEKAFLSSQETKEETVQVEAVLPVHDEVRPSEDVLAKDDSTLEKETVVNDVTGTHEVKFAMPVHDTEAVATATDNSMVKAKPAVEAVLLSRAPVTQSSSSSESSPTSTTPEIYVAIGVVTAVLLIAGIVCYAKKHNKKQQSRAEAYVAPPPPAVLSKANLEVAAETNHINIMIDTQTFGDSVEGTQGATTEISQSEIEGA